MPTVEKAHRKSDGLTPVQRNVQYQFKQHPRDLILKLAAEGRTDREIADQIGISERSLKLWKVKFQLRRGRRFGLIHDASSDS